MDFTFDMYFRQFWSDSRLAFNGSNFGIDKLVVGAEYIRLIWVPDTFFVNEKVATFHKATTENQFLRISQSKQSCLDPEGAKSRRGYGYLTNCIVIVIVIIME